MYNFGETILGVLQQQDQLAQRRAENVVAQQQFNQQLGLQQAQFDENKAQNQREESRRSAADAANARINAAKAWTDRLNKFGDDYVNYSQLPQETQSLLKEKNLITGKVINSFLGASPEGGYAANDQDIYVHKNVLDAALKGNELKMKGEKQAADIARGKETAKAALISAGASASQAKTAAERLAYDKTKPAEGGTQDKVTNRKYVENLQKVIKTVTDNAGSGNDVGEGGRKLIRTAIRPVLASHGLADNIVSDYYNASGGNWDTAKSMVREDMQAGRLTNDEYNALILAIDAASY